MECLWSGRRDLHVVRLLLLTLAMCHAWFNLPIKTNLRLPNHIATLLKDCSLLISWAYKFDVVKIKLTEEPSNEEEIQWWLHFAVSHVLFLLGCALLLLIPSSISAPLENNDWQVIKSKLLNICFMITVDVGCKQGQRVKSWKWAQSPTYAWC